MFDGGMSVLALIKLQNIFLSIYPILLILTEQCNKNVFAKKMYLLSSNTHSHRMYSTKGSPFHALTAPIYSSNLF